MTKTLFPLAAFVALWVAGVHPCLAQGADCPAQSVSDQLPGAVRQQLPTGQDAESVAWLDRDVPGALIAVVTAPKQFFSPSFCRSWSLSDYRRSLLVWHAEGERWRLVGRNEKAVWPIDTVGWAFVDVEAEGEDIVLSQRSAPIRTTMLDEWRLRYMTRAGRVQLARRTSEVTYNWEGEGGDSSKCDAVRQGAARDRDANADAIDGFQAELDYLRGQGELREFVACHAVKATQLRAPKRPVYLEDVRDVLAEEAAVFTSN